MNILDTSHPITQSAYTLHILHPAHISWQINSLENFYIQLFQRCNTIINDQSQTEINPVFDLIYDTQLNHACVQCLSSVQRDLLTKHPYYFTWFVSYWEPFHLHAKI